MSRRRHDRSGLGAALLLAAWCASTSAIAAQPPRPAYEDRLLQQVLSARGLTLASAPEGKQISELVIESTNIIGPTDPYPEIVNIAHVPTRPQVIARELLLHAGDLYRADLAAESERNLRKVLLLVIARVVPVEGRTPGTVALLVVTKDLWSIRFGVDFTLVGTLLQYLRTRPSELNLLGWNHQVSLDLERKLDTFAFGGAYTDPRFLGSFVGISGQGQLILNWRTGVLEGSRGHASLGRPLVSLEDAWAWSGSGGWEIYRVRNFRGARIWELPFTDSTGAANSVPYIYDQREFSGAASLTRSWGHELKTNLTFSAGGYSHHYTPPEDLGLTPEQSGYLATNHLPRTEDVAYGSVALQLYRARYVVMRDLITFGVSEDFQLGHQISLVARYAEPLTALSRRFLEVGASVRYRWLVLGDLLTVEGAATSRFVPGATGEGVDGPWVNRRLALELRNATPYLGPGRLVARVLWDVRDNDLNHEQLLLGGGNGLRGLAPDLLSGTKELLFNLEYRTRALEVLTVQTGLVLFWDAGSAYVERPALVHTVGIGVRIVVPQFQLLPIRVDLGFVLNGAPPDSFLDRASASFGQVEQLRPGFLDTPL